MLLQPMDAYCERTSAAYWAEPVNALTNLAFVLVALLMWRRSAGLPVARGLSMVLGIIGVGSFLFHTHANRATAILDVAPILGFILIYVFAATRDFLGLRAWWPWAAVIAFFPYAALTVPVFASLLPIGSSAGYAPIPVLILAYALALRHRAPATAKGMALGAVILVVSLIFRTLDGPLCPIWPLGTHFMWHLLNAVMLGVMIEIYRRHMLAGPMQPG
ncbi:ceramidase domain-containing protein [Tabrizicola sp.]|uniref:ceramidase domain-containing protein n=1 Tax=Tabrizicola sp. TaxID=2005166 RepID=UPI00286B8612|nr:ceramidase domain-containing protein [Tabrizicola sp.]